MYWKIENWKVVEFFRQVPRVIGNTSLPANPTNETLKEFNILPIIWESPVLEEWQTYWKANYTIWENEIVEVKEVIEESLLDYKYEKIIELSARCRADIIAEYSEDDQRNLTARWVELLDKKLDWIITPEEQAELTAIKESKVFIDTRLAEYHNQKDIVISLETYKEVKDYILSLNTEEIWV